MKLITRGPFSGCASHGAAVLYVDPPWTFTTFSEDPGNRAPPYPTMSMEEIAALPLYELAQRDCWLYCWTSGPYLQHTLDIIRDHWGFTYSSTAFTWVKLKSKGTGFHRGLGKTTRKNTETVLLAKLGSPPILARPDELLVTVEEDEGEVFISPVREHSRKPDEIRDRIQEMARGPYQELFARQRVEGWRAWGNQCNRWAPIVRGTTDADVQGVRPG